MSDAEKVVAAAKEELAPAVGWWGVPVPKWVVGLLVLGGFLVGTLVGKLG
jgi:hypothetical protein